MAVIAVVAVLLAGIGSWVVLGRALSPLEAITETVDQINRADDLSRRIPYQEQNEDEISCIKREIKEELNIEIVILKRLIPVTHKYPNFEINLIPYVVHYQSGELKLNEHINYKLLKINELNSLDWAEADIPILKQITCC